ncbi:hypothetical protein ABZW18_11330 [Streptomyces sp. NPDC004647]|uniref:hypothetical protein n=1 Tax=Streptomyces sp. NPDC004647 TaxID=3154671 RepID=UPI0033BF01E5
MQRRSYVPGAVLAAALLAIGLTGCTGGTEGGAPEDPKPGGPTSTTPAAEPGKYRTLPEPCGAPGRGTLRTLLPGIDDLEGEDREKAYDGQASITYDTDRRVGCLWKADTSAGTRNLSIDFERVVSYDPAVSDDDRAQELYDKQAAAAHIPATVPEGGGAEEGSGEPSASASESAADKVGETGEPADETGSPEGTDDKSDKDNKGKGGGGSASPSGSPDPSADPDIAPRSLEDIGDVAYLDDRLVTGDSGVHRDITIVFRASNVLVTLEYDQWSALEADQPDSLDLQTKARTLARELVGRFSE